MYHAPATSCLSGSIWCHKPFEDKNDHHNVLLFALLTFQTSNFPWGLDLKHSKWATIRQRSDSESQVSQSESIWLATSIDESSLGHSTIADYHPSLSPFDHTLDNIDHNSTVFFFWFATTTPFTEPLPSHIYHHNHACELCCRTNQKSVLVKDCRELLIMTRHVCAPKES